jgi:UDP-glucose 4-epimerase
VGSRLVSVLAHQSDMEVRAVDRHAGPPSSVDEQVVLDVAADRDALRAACAGVDTVVHLAGASDPMMRADPAAGLANTLIGSQYIAEAAAVSDVKRVIYVSTLHVYGARLTGGAVITEELRPEPRASYGISRLASEHVFAEAAGRGFELVVFRLTNSVGAPMHSAVKCWSLVVNDLCRQGAQTGELVLQSPGVQWRDFVALGDVCTILAETLRPGSLAPGVYNLGAGRSRTILDMAHLVQDAFERCNGSRPRLVAPAPPDDRPSPYSVSIEKLASAGWRAQTPIEGAIEETVRFCLDRP